MKIKALLSSILLCFVSLTSFAQTNEPIIVGGGLTIDYRSPKEYEIGPIRVEGADNFDHNAIKLIAGLRQGQKITIPGEDISKALKNLYKEDLFSYVEIAAEKELAGVIYLVILVEPRPKLSRFKFIGLNKREADKVREEINLFAGKTITENLVFQTTSQINGYFREKGYYSVSVDVDRKIDTLINNSEIFYITVDKGEKVKIKDIVIEGNTAIPMWKTYAAMKDTKRKGPLRIFKRSKFSISAYERDKALLLDKFNAIGLRDAAFVEDTFYLLDEKNLIIKLTVDEGEKYYFGDINWIGNTKYRSSFLDTVLGIEYGDVYDKPLLEQRLYQSQDGRDISALYMDRGYLFFQITPVETNVDDNHINYEMRIVEGKEARIKNIIIKGNTKTNDYVIRREIRTKPGDLFNRNDIIRTQRELAQLGYFNEQAFQINPLPNPQDGTVDIEYIVEEKSSDQIELSGGYGGVGANGPSIIGTLGLTFNNFSTKNFWKKEAWTPLPAGDGQRLSIRAQTNGRFYQSFNFSFTEPWLGGKKPNSLTTYITHTLLSSTGLLKTNPNYSGTSITGGGIGFGRRKKVPDDFFQVYYELGYNYYEVVDDFRFPDFFTNGIANDISLKYVLSRNSISAPIYPQSGSNLTFTGKSTVPYSVFQQGVDFAQQSVQERYKYLEYYKLKFTGQWYFPLSTDKKLVLTPRVGFGFLGAFNATKGIIPFERFALGGSGLSGIQQIGGREIIAHRGYEDASLSTNGGDPLIAKYSLELRYPISLNPQATFYALAFAEAANTFPTVKQFDPFNVKRAAGVGIRVFLPMFGLLGLDYGFGFDKVDYWGRGFSSNTENASISAKGYYPKLTFTIGANIGEL
ncbi:MAG: outer membrane protein insertion porin family [Psychromonas sp.]|jgi:outer membrane protein insertion porin family